jgi:hypothetical protein
MRRAVVQKILELGNSVVLVKSLLELLVGVMERRPIRVETLVSRMKNFVGSKELLLEIPLLRALVRSKFLWI